MSETWAKRSARWREVRRTLRHRDKMARRGERRSADIDAWWAEWLLNGSKRRAWALGNGGVGVR